MRHQLNECLLSYFTAAGALFSVTKLTTMFSFGSKLSGKMRSVHHRVSHPGLSEMNLPRGVRVPHFLAFRAPENHAQDRGQICIAYKLGRGMSNAEVMGECIEIPPTRRQTPPRRALARRAAYGTENMEVNPTVHYLRTPTNSIA